MHVDLILDSRLNASEITELGLLAEKYGVHTIWVASYLDSREPFVNLSQLASQSSQINLGPVALNPFDTHPIRIAAGLLTLNELSNGRASIVIGGGGEALQSLNLKTVKRVRAVRECIEILKSISPSHALNYDGEIFQVNNYHPFWATQSMPRVYVAANKPQMLKMSSRLSDGIMMSDLPALLIKRTVEEVSAHLGAFGRDLDDFRFNNFMAWALYDDKEEAIKEAKQWLGYRGLFRRWVITTFMSDADYDLIEAHKQEIYQMPKLNTHSVPGIPDDLLDKLVDHLTLTGHVSEVDQKIEHLLALKAAGLTDVALELRQNPAASIKLIGEQVIPALNG